MLCRNFSVMNNNSNKNKNLDNLNSTNVQEINNNLRSIENEKLNFSEKILIQLFGEQIRIITVGK